MIPACSEHPKFGMRRLSYTITVYFEWNLRCLTNGAKVIQIRSRCSHSAVYSAVCDTLQLAVDDRVHLFAVQLVQVR